jgi:uncharacterized protein YecE (DUF72 family)
MIIVGTSGWQYRDWRGVLYPPGVPQRGWLEFYAGHFATVEINSAFYRLPSRDTFARWGSAAPADFRAAVKASRFLTHTKRLRDPAEPVARLLDRARGLGAKLGPVLLQLPPTLRFDADLLDAVLRAFGRGRGAAPRVAVEPRHESWWTPQARDLLERHGAALCWADREGRPVTPLWRTADFGYVRLHEGRAQPRPRYGRAALRGWRDRITDAYGDRPDVYVYFNNDPGGAAVLDAVALAGEAGRAGAAVSRAAAP